jgi:hypothetical protein
MLRAQADRLQKELDRLRTANSASKAEIERLGREQEAMERQLADAKLPAKEAFRLPKEKGDGGQDGIFVFVRGGKMYPLYVFRSQVRERNQQTIRWREEDERSVPELITALGWGPGAAPGSPLDRFLNQVPTKQAYLSFMVWPDSFSEFREIKEECSRRGIELGFEIYTGPLPSLVTNGRGPAPRL